MIDSQVSAWAIRQWKWVWDGAEEEMRGGETTEETEI